MIKQIIDEWNQIENLLIENIKYYQSPIKQEPYRYGLLYIESNKIIGAIIYTILYENAEIEEIAVIKPYQNQKIGSKLLEEAIYRIKEQNVSDITLEVNKNNYNAIKLYEKYGFQNVAIRKNYYPDGDAIVMWKKV